MATRPTLAALLLGAGALAGCAAALASAPPSAAPSIDHETMVEGKRVSVAARGARALQEYGFTTRRFGSDSTWGSRSQSHTSARLRYAQATSDSTRVSIELWLPCGTGYGCGRGDAARLIARLQQPEESPESGP